MSSSSELLSRQGQRLLQIGLALFSIRRSTALLPYSARRASVFRCTPLSALQGVMLLAEGLLCRS